MYEIHGKQVEYGGEECGLFSPVAHSVSIYLPVDMDKFVGALNAIPPDQAIVEASELRDLAARQARFIPPDDVSHSRIENTRKFAEEVLKALSGT